MTFRINKGVSPRNVDSDINKRISPRNVDTNMTKRDIVTQIQNNRALISKQHGNMHQGKSNTNGEVVKSPRKSHIVSPGISTFGRKSIQSPEKEPQGPQNTAPVLSSLFVEVTAVGRSGLQLDVCDTVTQGLGDTESKPLKISAPIHFSCSSAFEKSGLKIDLKVRVNAKENVSLVTPQQVVFKESLGRKKVEFTRLTFDGKMTISGFEHLEKVGNIHVYDGVRIPELSSKVRGTVGVHGASSKVDVVKDATRVEVDSDGKVGTICKYTTLSMRRNGTVGNVRFQGNNKIEGGTVDYSDRIAAEENLLINNGQPTVMIHLTLIVLIL